jgi:hypothetical protein
VSSESIEEKVKKVLVDTPDYLKYKDESIKRVVEYYAKKPNVTDNMISACPRSGTRYISVLLRGVGIDMPHEAIGRDGVVSWQHIADKEFTVKCDNILHQVRDPLDTISSIVYTLDPVGYPFLLYIIPFEEYSIDDILNSKELKIKFAMHIYEEWNNLIDERKIGRYRVEDLPNAFPGVCYYLGYSSKLNHVPAEKVNSIPHDSLSWDDLDNISKEMANKIRKKAEIYGYL